MMSFVQSILMGAVLALLAQPVAVARFSADNGAPLVGEPVVLTLTATLPQNATITQWPEFPADWPPLEVQAVGEVAITQAEGSAIYQQTLTVVAWTLGEFETPETIIAYEVGGEAHTLTVESTFFSVDSVLDPADTALRPLKPPEALPFISPLIITGAVGAVLVLSAFGLRTLLTRRMLRPQTQTGPLTATKAALAELRRIAGRNLAPAQIYPAVADTLRGYTATEYRVPALDLTTWELMGALRGQMADTKRTDLQRILDQADLVKFARYNPDAEAAKRYLDTAAQWLKALDEDSPT